MTTTVRSLFASNVSGTFFDSSTQLQLDSINATIDLSAISNNDIRHSHVEAPAVIAEAFVDVCGRVDARTYNRNGRLTSHRYHSNWDEFVTGTCPESLNGPSLFDEIGVSIDPTSKYYEFSFTPSNPVPRDEIYEKVQKDLEIEMANMDGASWIPKNRADAKHGRRKLDTNSYTVPAPTPIDAAVSAAASAGTTSTPGDSPASASTCTSAAVGVHVAPAPSQTQASGIGILVSSVKSILCRRDSSVPVEPTPMLTQEDGAGWGSLFDIEEGSWKCGSCMVWNKKDVKECVSCTVARPGSAIQDGTASSAANVADSSETPAAGSIGPDGFTFGGFPLAAAAETPAAAIIAPASTTCTSSSASTGFVFGNTFVPNANDTDEGEIEQVDANADGDEKEDDVKEQDVMAADDVDFAIGEENKQNVRFADELVASEHKVSMYEQKVDYTAQEQNQAESKDELEMFGNDVAKYHQWLRSDEATRISGGKYATLIGYVIKVTPKMVRVSIVGIDDCEVYVHRRHIEPGYCGCFDE